MREISIPNLKHLPRKLCPSRCLWVCLASDFVAYLRYTSENSKGSGFMKMYQKHMGQEIKLPTMRSLIEYSRCDAHSISTIMLKSKEKTAIIVKHTTCSNRSIVVELR